MRRQFVAIALLILLPPSLLAFDLFKAASDVVQGAGQAVSNAGAAVGQAAGDIVKAGGNVIQQTGNAIENIGGDGAKVLAAPFQEAGTVVNKLGEATTTLAVSGVAKPTEAFVKSLASTVGELARMRSRSTIHSKRARPS